MREKYQEYKRWKEAMTARRWFPFAEMALDLVLAVLTVFPLMWKLVRDVPFSYEVNDDAVIVQILNGSFTGTPDPHGIHVREPLTLLMTWLYEHVPDVTFLGVDFPDINWYVGTIVIIEVLALIAVLYRILEYFQCNRLLICLVFWLLCLILWSPCFAHMTFTTAAAFMSCMALLYFGFSEWDAIWRPWNAAITAAMCIAGWCLRASCLYMILPFLVAELIFKFHSHLFKSWRPWAFILIFAALGGWAWQVNERAYSSEGWQNFLEYNRQRAYLQDYGRFSEYSQDRAFYDSIGMSEQEVHAMIHYSYCMVDGYGPEVIGKVYEHQRAVSGEKYSDNVIRKVRMEPGAVRALLKHLDSYREKARAMVHEQGKVQSPLRRASTDVWPAALLFLALAVICFRKEHLPQFLLFLCEGAAFIVILVLEWEYLAMNGRFPLRVEEAMRLTTFCTGILMLGHFAFLTRESRLARVPWPAQLLVLVLALTIPAGGAAAWADQYMDELAQIQNERNAANTEKQEILEYCGRHEKNLYILNTGSFIKSSTPYDDFHQGNWMMSGSWSAYSPLYYEKLDDWKTKDLASDFLQRENVRVITRGKRDMAHIMGIDDSSRVTSQIVDQYRTRDGTLFCIYRVEQVSSAQ